MKPPSLEVQFRVVDEARRSAIEALRQALVHLRCSEGWGQLYFIDRLQRFERALNDDEQVALCALRELFRDSETAVLMRKEIDCIRVCRGEVAAMYLTLGQAARAGGKGM